MDSGEQGIGAQKLVWLPKRHGEFGQPKHSYIGCSRGLM